MRENIFDRSAYRMLHLVAKEQESCPLMEKNVYIQHRGGMLGQYGGNAEGEPPILYFDDDVEASVREILGDRDAEIYMLE